MVQKHENSVQNVLFCCANYLFDKEVLVGNRS